MPSRRTDPKLKLQAKRGIPEWAIAAGIGVAVVIGVVVLFTLQTPPATTFVPSGVTASGKTKGDPNAKLEFVVFSDFK
ncbi:MAG: hypothetical protein FJ009_08645 [Chloroflexi bacterium]|nr:hypothetical protein [Chloroflexota bacterium]